VYKYLFAITSEVLSLESLTLLSGLRQQRQKDRCLAETTLPAIWYPQLLTLLL
jgi:hypothetical protein